MKVCPSCSFANEERSPTCVLCYTVLVDVRSTPSPDPTNQEHEQRALTKKRHQITGRQIRFATILYCVVITLLAAFPGLILRPQPLILYFLSSLIVAIAVAQDFVGQFSASILQGGLSVLLLIYFGPMQPFIFFMLVGHITVPAVFWHWIDLIHSANR